MNIDSEYLFTQISQFIVDSQFTQNLTFTHEITTPFDISGTINF
jgi:hypothetical protein